MANPALTRRMKGYFERQMALYEELLAYHDSFQEQLDAGREGELVEAQRVHMREAAALEREFELLRREWVAAEDLDNAERAEVRDIARQAEALGREAAQRNAEAAAEIEQRMNTMKRDKRDLRKGLEALRKFRQEPGAKPGFIDKRT